MDKGREGGLLGEQVGERAQGGQLHETERSLRSKRRGARPLACRWCGLHQPCRGGMVWISVFILDWFLVKADLHNENTRKQD